MQLMKQCLHILSDTYGYSSKKVSFHRLQYIVMYKVTFRQLPNVLITWNFMLTPFSSCVIYT